MLKKKKFRHTQLNLAVLKWQLCQLRHTFYPVPVHLPLMFSSFSLCHCTLIGPERANSEFSKIRYYFRKSWKSFIHPQIKTPFTTFLPRDAQTRMIIYNAPSTDKSGVGEDWKTYIRVIPRTVCKSLAPILLPSPVFSPLETSKSW